MIALLLACTSGEEEPAPLLPLLAGGWEGQVVEASLRRRDVIASFTFADGHLGGLVGVDDPDGERVYELLEAIDVAPLGVSLRFVELTGVHELYLDAAAPIPPIYGSFRERVYCDEAEGGWCEDLGAITLERL